MPPAVGRTRPGGWGMEAEGFAVKRYGIVALLAFWVGGTGCAGPARRDMFSKSRPDAFAEAPAPPQVTIASPTVRPDGRVVATAAGSRSDAQGLSKYFPSFRRAPTEPVKVASTSRPTWFGLRKPKISQVYTTDARVDLNRKPFEPSMLPVALQVPTDHSVTPTSAEGSTPVVDPAPAPPSSVKPRPVAETPPSPAEAEAPKAPAVEVAELAPASPVAGAPTPGGQGMPDVPPVDPRERPRMGPAGGVNPDAPPATAPNPVEAKADREPAEARKETVANRKGDEKAVQAAPPAATAANSLGLPEVTLPAAYFRHETMAVRGSSHGPVLASPQIQPTSQAKPTPQARPTSQAKPTPRAQASPQSGIKATKQRPCLRRMVRKKFKLGEFASPPTAQPH